MNYTDKMNSKRSQDDLKQNIPYDLLRLGTACNAQCAFCNVPSEDRSYPELDLLAAKKKLNEFYSQNKENTRISISGGEPTMYPELEAIIKYAKTIGIGVVEVQTNGFKFEDRDYAKAIKASGLDKAFVSLHSSVPETHDILMGTRGAFAMCVNGIKNLIAVGIEVTLNPVLTTLNFRDIPELFEFVHKQLFGIRYISLSVVQPRGRASANMELLPRYSLLSPFVAKALKLAAEYDLTVNNPYCGLPLCIGEWYKYLERNVEYSLNTLAKTPQDPDKIQGPECRRCRLNRACNGVWNEYADHFGFNDLHPL